MARLLAAIDGWQRRHAAAGFAIAVAKKFGEDRGSNLAALIAFYAFFSLFPLLLAFVSVLGFVLDDNPSLRDDVIDSAVARIPVIGDPGRRPGPATDGQQPRVGDRPARRAVGRAWRDARVEPCVRGDLGRAPRRPAERDHGAGARIGRPWSSWRSC